MKFLLKIIVFFENNNHWIILYHKPSFKNIHYDQWSFYNEKCGYFQEYNNISFMISHLLKMNRVPLFLIYVSVPEFQVSKILEIKSTVINPSN